MAGLYLWKPLPSIKPYHNRLIWLKPTACSSAVATSTVTSVAAVSAAPPSSCGRQGRKHFSARGCQSRGSSSPPAPPAPAADEAVRAARAARARRPPFGGPLYS